MINKNTAQSLFKIQYVILTLIGILLFIKCTERKIDFDQGKWINITSEERFKTPSKRQMMIEDLELNYLESLTKEDAIELLGKPDAFEHWKLQDTTIGYVLGGESNYGVGIEYLQIWFDKNGNYISHEIKRS